MFIGVFVKVSKVNLDAVLIEESRNILFPK